MSQALLSLIAGVALLYVTVKWPPVTIAIFMLTAATDVSLGTAGYLEHFLGSNYERIICGFSILAAVISYVRILNKPIESHGDRRCRSLAHLAAIGTYIVVMSGVWRGYPVGALVLYVAHSYLHIILVVLCYWAKPFAQRTYIATLAIQLAIATLLIAIPGGPWKVLDVRNTYGRSSIKEYEFKFARSEAEQSDRYPAQFYNANGLGTYAVIGIVTGLSLLSRKEKKAVVATGFALALTGVICWAATFTRGATVGGLLGLCLSLVVLLRERRPGTWLPLTAFGGTLAGVLWLTLTNWALLEKALLVRSDNFGVKYRADALTFAGESLGSYAALGYPQIEEIGVTIPSPHQAMVYYAVHYGIVVGIVVSGYFIWGLIGAWRTLWLSGRSILFAATNAYPLDPTDRLLFSSYALISIAVGITNGTAGCAMSWIGFTLGCIPWAYNPEQIKSRTLLQPNNSSIVGGI